MPRTTKNSEESRRIGSRDINIVSVCPTTSVRARRLHQALERGLIERELGSRYSDLDLRRIAEHHHVSVLEVLVLRPLGQALAVWIALRNEVDPVRRHLVGQLHIDVIPRIDGPPFRVVEDKRDLPR